MLHATNKERGHGEESNETTKAYFSSQGDITPVIQST
jgi:hypothetical protein